MGGLIREFDWSQTVLGRAEQWPQSLKTATSIVLESHFGMYVAWGAEYIQIYNDLYRPILGSKKHPAIGKRASETFSESWHIIEPLFDQVMRGQAVGSEDWMLPLERHGYLEECFFTFSYSPIRDESGDVGGVFVTVTETTGRVLGARRLLTLRMLAERASKAETEDQAWHGAHEALASNTADLPFVGLYAVDPGGASAHLTGPLPQGAQERALPPSLHFAENPIWPIADSFRAGEPTVLTDVRQRAGDVAGDSWPEPVHSAALVPISRPNLPQPYGVLVAGLSPRLAFDHSYRDFLLLAADHIATAVGNARSYEDERRRAEALAEIDRAKTIFFSNVSHEFRTPLTLMLSPTEEALAAPEQALTGEGLATVYRNELRLLKLVNNLLEFSRIEAGRAQASFELTDLAALTRDLASSFRSAIDRSGLLFEVDCPPLPCAVCVDREMWEKIVLNLLSNALKFTFEGSIRIALAERDGNAELQVCDTGVGIEPAELPRLFERFHRVRNTRARTGEGSGIGLALVQELVKMHDGVLSVTSEPGVGTTFTVSIPVNEAECAGPVSSGALPQSRSAQTFVEEALSWSTSKEPESREAAVTTPEAEAVANGSGGSIVIVDDNADMRGYISRILGDRWEVLAYGDGNTALEAIRERPPLLVITDVMMPGLDGFQLLEKLRESPDTRDVPVVMLSARAGEEARIDGLQAGADDYLVKPFSARELRARVEAQILRAAVRDVKAAHNRRLLTIFRHAPVAIAILTGPDHVFEFANEPYLELIAFRPITGKPIRDALPELHNQGIYELLDDVYRSGQRFSTESMRLIVHRGPQDAPEEGFFKFIYQPMRNEDGEVEGIVVVASEVTEMANARREAEAANRAKDDFIAMLSHELRGPLSPILTALHLIRMKGVEAVERERTVIERQVKHMVNLVDDLLDVSRITNGRIELKKQHLQLADVVTQAVEIADPLLESRRQTLTVNISDEDLSVDGDPERLSQVVANLLTNSAKFTAVGGAIVVDAGRDGDSVALSVRDNGIGIDADTLKNIFEPFVQAGTSLDRSDGGLGLGLAIAHSLVTLHGGTISAASEGRGTGAKFEVRLPYCPPPVSAQQKDPALPKKEIPAAKGVKVLIVDDNKEAAEMLSLLVSTLGYETRVANDGPRALEAAESFNPDIALLDIGLPIMNGYEVAQRIRAGGSPVRLVAVTGYGQPHDRASSSAAGFDAHVVKPVDFEELTALLKQYSVRS